MDSLAEREEHLAAYCKALGHPIRIKMLRTLAGRDQYCGDLVDLFGLAQSTISHHLKALREAGLIIGEEQGPSVCYRLNRGEFDQFQALLRQLFGITLAP